MASTKPLPSFVVPESVVQENGSSALIELGASQGKLLILTLGITRIIEQESLDVSIWGSPDGQSWGPRPIVSFPQKFYCGVYTILLDLADHADHRFLRADWAMSRWGRGDPKPLFGFYLFAQEAASHPVAGATV